MKNINTIKILILLGLLFVFIPLHNAEAATITVQADHLSVDKKYAKVGDTIQVSMGLIPSSGEVQSVDVYYQSADLNWRYENHVALTFDSSTNRWQGSIPLTVSYAKGSWKINRIVAKIGSSNYFITNNLLYQGGGDSADLSGGDFFVDETGYVPELKSISIDKKQGTINDQMIVSFDVKGITETSISEVSIYYHVPGSDNTIGYVSLTRPLNLSIGPTLATGTWKIDHVVVTDYETKNTNVYYNPVFYEYGNTMDFSNADFEVVPPKGWIQYYNQWHYYDPDTGEMVKGWFSNGKDVYYFDQDGARCSGWQEIEGNYYYFDTDGKMVTGWVTDGYDTYYLNTTGELVYDWQFIDNHWYYFDEYGAMVKGWLWDGSNYYYFKSDGTPASGWLKLDGDYYYFGDKGQSVTGWRLWNGHWYFLNSDGVMQTGLYKVGGSYYYSDASGAMQTGWEYINKKWYYFKPGVGSAQIGWFLQGKSWYYFNPTGDMVTGWKQMYYQRPNWPNLLSWFYFDGSGAMQTGWKYLGGKWYHLESDGVMSTGVTKIDGVQYYFKLDSGAMAAGEWIKRGPEWHYYLSSGKPAIGWQTINGKKYYFNSYGAWVK